MILAFEAFEFNVGQHIFNAGRYVRYAWFPAIAILIFWLVLRVSGSKKPKIKICESGSWFFYGSFLVGACCWNQWQFITKHRSIAVAAFFFISIGLVVAALCLQRLEFRKRQENKAGQTNADKADDKAIAFLQWFSYGYALTAHLAAILEAIW